MAEAGVNLVTVGVFGVGQAAAGTGQPDGPGAGQGA